MIFYLEANKLGHSGTTDRQASCFWTNGINDSLNHLGHFDSIVSFPKGIILNELFKIIVFEQFKNWKREMLAWNKTKTKIKRTYIVLFKKHNNNTKIKMGKATEKHSIAHKKPQILSRIKLKTENIKIKAKSKNA